MPNKSMRTRQTVRQGAALLVTSLASAFSSLPALAQTQSLPPEIAKDMYMMQLAETLKAKDFSASLRDIERLRALDVELPDTIDYFEGVAGCETEDYARCRRALTDYVTRVGADGRYYRMALPLLAKAIDKVEAEDQAIPATLDASADEGGVTDLASVPANASSNAGTATGEVAVVAPGALITNGRCAIVVASRQSIDEARAFIRDYPRKPKGWNLYQTPNGWIALSPYTILNENTTAQLDQLRSRGDIPDDAFCTPGKSFTAQLDTNSGRVIRKVSGL